MSDYKRLTRRNADGTTWVKCSVCDIQDKCDYTKETCCQELQDRLAEIEDKIEQGTLIELPCKVGDTVYWVWEEYTNGKQKLFIEEWEVEIIHIEENAWSVKGFGKEREDGSRPFFWCHSSRFGIWWFLTREEAEKRLLELQGETKL